MKDESICPVCSRKDHDKKADSPKGLFDSVKSIGKLAAFTNPVTAPIAAGALAMDAVGGMMGGAQQGQKIEPGGGSLGSVKGGQLAGLKSKSRKISLDSVAKLDAENKKNSPSGFSAGITSGSTQWSGSEQNATDAINMRKRLKASTSLELADLKGRRKGIQLTKGQRKQ